mmetsp:Transcript_42711/g.138522  ORF Transcript_42711/g.138522 Transcript_42711/m.138522 type:complete len:204 (-) Transcript_42711:311-922(-)
MAKGRERMKAMMVRTPYRLGAFMFSPTGLSIVFLERTAREAKATLEVRAPYRAFMVKESSLSDASETPTMMGSSDAYTCHLKTVPSTKKDSTHVKSGSAALTVWAKETAPAPSAITAPAWPRACAAPMGRRVFQPSMPILGGLRMPVPQRKRTHGMPTKSETTVIVHGIGNAFWHRLLVMLYMTLRKYQEKKRKPSLTLSTRA